MLQTRHVKAFQRSTFLLLDILQRYLQQSLRNVGEWNASATARNTEEKRQGIGYDSHN